MNIEHFIHNANGNQKIIKWINTHLKSYLIKKEKNQETLTNFSLSESEIDHIIDFFKSEKQDPRNRISRISVDEAHRQAKVWQERLNKKFKHVLKETESDVKIAKSYEDGYRWVILKTKESYQREGNLMGHCVSSYYDHKDSIIYSLRDENNQPHCTIEIKKDRFASGKKMVEQIKGKRDRAVISKYHKYVVDFLNTFAISMDKRDLVLNNFLDYEGKIYATTALPEGFSSKEDIRVVCPITIPNNLSVRSLTMYNVANDQMYKFNDIGYHAFGNYYVRGTDFDDHKNAAMIEFNSNPIHQNWKILKTISMFGFNIKGSSIHCQKSNFVKCLINIPILECKESIGFNNSRFKIQTIKTKLLSFYNYKKVEITEQMECEQIFVKGVDHLVINSERLFNKVKLENVKKITIIGNLNCDNLNLVDCVLDEENLSKIVVFNNCSANVGMENCIVPEKIQFKNKEQKINVLTLINTPSKVIANISGLALFSDKDMILENSSFDLAY